MKLSTLALDIGYQPYTVLPWSDAIGKIQRGVAEPLEWYAQDQLYTNDCNLDIYDPARFGPLGKFFDEELLSDKVVRVSCNKPAVIRVFTNAVRKKKVRFSRQNLYLRDGYRCQYEGCKTTAKWLKRHGASTLPAIELTFDHVVPRAQGGRTTWKNIVACCKQCNGKKDDRTPAQAGMVLLSKPVEPKDVPLISQRIHTPDEWRSWMYWTVELTD